MRTLSVPARWAAVTALTIAASTGCMSVGDDGARPGPSGSTDSKGRAVEPNGETVAGSGGAGHRGGDAHTHSDADTDADRKKPGGTPSPEKSGAVPSATPKSGAPRPEPGTPQPSRPGHPPAPTPSTPARGSRRRSSRNRRPRRPPPTRTRNPSRSPPNPPSRPPRRRPPRSCGRRRWAVRRRAGRCGRRRHHRRWGRCSGGLGEGELRNVGGSAYGSRSFDPIARRRHRRAPCGAYSPLPWLDRIEAVEIANHGVTGACRDSGRFRISHVNFQF